MFFRSRWKTSPSLSARRLGFGVKKETHDSQRGRGAEGSFLVGHGCRASCFGVGFAAMSMPTCHTNCCGKLHITQSYTSNFLRWLVPVPSSLQELHEIPSLTSGNSHRPTPRICMPKRLAVTHINVFGPTHCHMYRKTGQKKIPHSHQR